MLFFEFDPKKAKGNKAKHGVTFEEASTIFADSLSLTIEDSLGSFSEKRYVTIGCSSLRNILVVVHTERGDRIRIISARLATKNERRQYEKKK